MHVSRTYVNANSFFEKKNNTLNETKAEKALLDPAS